MIHQDRQATLIKKHRFNGGITNDKVQTKISTIFRTSISRAKKSLFSVEKALKSIEKSLNLQQGVKTRNR